MDTPRYASLRDYLRVVRSHRLLIVGLALLFGVLAYYFSERQSPTYEAESSLSFRDPARDAELLEDRERGEQEPGALAALNAELATRPAVARRVKKALKTDLSTDELQDAVSAHPEARTNLVIVTATSGDPKFAARLANEFARQIQTVVTRQERRRYITAAKGVRRRFERERKQLDLGESRAAFNQAIYEQRIGTLLTLADIVRPVEISRAATTPDDPVSPRPVRNGLLAGLLGLVVGVAVAFLRDALDIRLRASRQVRSHLGLPVLGQLSAASMGSAGFNADGRRSLSERDLEAVRVLRANLEFLDPDRPLRSIAITSALPGEGKSTVAAALAQATAGGGKRTLLIECDLRRPVLASRLGVNSQPGLSEYLSGHAPIQQIIQPLALEGPYFTDGVVAGSDAGVSPSVPRLGFIPGGEPTHGPTELLRSKRFESLMTMVADLFDLVVLDTTPLLSVGDALEVLPRVDGVLMCVRASRTTTGEASAAKEVLERFPPRPTGVVVTSVRPKDEASYGYYEAAPGGEAR